MPADVFDNRNLEEAAREIVSSFQGQRFQNVIALFDQLLHRGDEGSGAQIVEQLSTAAGKDLTSILSRSYAYNSCWFCEMGMARCEVCEGEGEVGERLHCVTCHGLGNVQCTVCSGSSFMSIDEVPDFLREAVVEQRVRLAARAFEDLERKYRTLLARANVPRSLVRRLHHKCQQALGVLRNCRAHVPRNQPEQIALFNELVRKIQNTYQQMTYDGAQVTLKAVERLVRLPDPALADLDRARSMRSVSHQLEVTRGYVDVLERLGAATMIQELREGIAQIEQVLHSGPRAKTLVPEAPARAPGPAAPAARAERTLEFLETLNEEQIKDVWNLFKQEVWGDERTWEDTKRCVAESDVNVAVVRVEGRDRRVVAYVRALTDGVYRAVGYDFVVAKDERGGGVGQLLVSRLLADPRLRGMPAIELHCTADRIDFFRQIGFTKHVDGSVYLRHVGRKD